MEVAPVPPSEQARLEYLAVAACREADRHLTAERTEEAIAAYREAVAAMGGWVEPILGLGDLLLGRGRGAEAVEVIARLVELEPQSPWAHNCLGLAHFRNGDKSEARASFRAALEQDPSFVEALANLGVLEWKEGGFELALDYFERAQVVEADNSQLAQNIGWVGLQGGLLERSKALLRRYLDRHPQDWEVAGLLAETLMAMGQSEEGRGLAFQVLTAKPNDKRARRLVEEYRGAQES